MDVDIEELAKVYEPEVIEYVLFLIEEEKACTQLIEFDYKYEEVPRPVFGYVKHKIMKSQVMDRKPKCIRARTVC
ncbi:hypothetical protein P4V63_01800 [Bacillus toyonensis]|uniref:hypothetical protein n=1 Tax=Bacillus toyonensis TaxID=155322 RepID=UPI002E1CDBD8|nr:hypothetical protein [Bacillus toyonensis]MEE2016737.1 hypothetical protein [Bacillus toyonensis]